MVLVKIDNTNYYRLLLGLLHKLSNFYTPKVLDFSVQNMYVKYYIVVYVC